MQSFHCINTTAATLRAVLCYIDSGVTPRIAFDRDDLADKLVEKVRTEVGDLGGSRRASITFFEHEDDLKYQFIQVCREISKTFDSIVNSGS